MTTAPKPLTKPQRNALTALRDLGDVPRGTAQAAWGFTTPREVAHCLWPDSPGWNKVSGRGATQAGGALGATMPMKAATLLWRLHERGLAHLAFDSNRWSITAAGRDALGRP